MRNLKTIIKIIGVSLLLFTCGNYKNTKQIKIATQVWATKNLDVNIFRNDDVIQEAKTNEEWMKAGNTGKPAWCYYGNNPQNSNKYGKLYNWFAVNDHSGLAPKGWYVPSDSE